MRLRIGLWRCGFGALLVAACVLGVAGIAWAATARPSNTVTPADLASNTPASANKVGGGSSEVAIIPNTGAPGCVVLDQRTHVTFTTLQEAVEAAQGGDTLEVTGICKGDTTITSATSPLTIKGSIDRAQLNGKNTDGSVLTVKGGTSVSVAGVTITGGNAAIGGGIYNEGELTLTGSWVKDNQAAYGGGIFNYRGAELTLDQTHVDSNTGDLGGGILNVENGYLTLDRSVVASSNKAYEFGGGIDNIQDSTLTLNDSRIEESTAPYGGGLDDNTSSLTTMYGSSIADNKASQGGGVRNEGDSTLQLNSISTIVENKATGGKGDGGGIYNQYGSTLDLELASVSKNTPENIFDEL